MSNAVFKQELWRKQINNDLDHITGLSNHSDHTYEGEIKFGNTLDITSAVRPTIGNYVPGTDIEFENVSGTAMKLVINKAKYATQQLDDVDRAQSIPGVMENATREMAKELHYEADKEVANVIKNATENGVDYIDEDDEEATATIAQEASATDVSDANALSRVDTGLTKLYENDVKPTENIWGEFSPAYYQHLRGKLTEVLTNNVELAKKGIVGKYYNVDVTIDNALPISGTSRYNVLRTGKAIAFAGQVDKVESGRREAQFADYVKALYVFGTRVVRPKEMYIIKEKVTGVSA